jgi:hypothetical protein
MAEASTLPDRVDARPLLRPVEGRLWRVCDDALDQIREAFKSAAAKRNLDAFITRSARGTWPGWVRFEAWMPAHERHLTARVDALVRIEPLPHRDRSVRISSELHHRGLRRWTSAMEVSPHGIAEDAQLDEAGIDRLVAYGVGEAAARPAAFRFDPLRGLFRRNQFSEFRTGPEVKFAYGAMVVGYIFTAMGTAGAVIGILLLAVAGLFLLGRWLERLGDKRVLVLDHGRPQAIPRVLTMLDSWYALVQGIGHSAEVCRQQLLERLSKECPLETSVALERIDYRTGSTLLAREQIVASYRRAVVFCHIYTYGDDLYVGWDAHLNRGEWREQDLQSGLSITQHAMARLTTVVTGSSQPTAYNLADVNGLMEWLHRHVSAHVRALLEEHKLDQQIDFTIIRAERQEALGTVDREQGPRRKPNFKRIA